MSLIRSIFFSHVAPIIRKGFQKPLCREDLPPISAWLDPRNTDPRFEALDRCREMELLSRLALVLRKRVIVVALISLTIIALKLLGPMLIYRMVGFVQEAVSGNRSLQFGIITAVGLCCSNILSSLLSQHYVYRIVSCTQLGINAINQRIYVKTLQLSARARENHEVGDVVNHMGADADAAAASIWAIVEIVSAFLIIAGVTVTLVWRLGWSAFVAVTIFLMAPFVSRVFSRRFNFLDCQIMKQRDQRISLLSQFLSGIRVVKAFVWEREAQGKVEVFRRAETFLWKRRMLLKSLSVLSYMALHTMACVATFGTFLLLGNKLDAATVFSTLALFSLIEHPFRQIPHFLAEYSAAVSAAGRIRRYLNSDAISLDARPLSNPSEPIGVSIKDANVACPNGSRLLLRKISLVVEPGESVAVVGPIGSGKTTLVKTLLGDLPLAKGVISFSCELQGQAPRFGYVPQEPFLINGTIRENILLGQVTEDLSDVVRNACLEQDIHNFSSGLDTNIGDQGLSLSGGQRQRINIARAAAAKAGLILLDDPLSAVDEVTEANLVKRLLFGEWGHVTRVVVTHRLAFLGHFDKVVFMEEGRIVSHGAMHELLDSCSRFRQFYANQNGRGEDPNNKEETREEVSRLEPIVDTALDEEDRDTGKVSPHVYWDYVKAMAKGKSPWRLIVIIACTAALSMTLPILQNAWFSFWIDGKAPVSILTEVYGYFRGTDFQNLATYALLSCFVLCGSFLQYLFWAMSSINAGKFLHSAALNSLLKTKLRYFDTTPSGRILNRFSRDLDTIDRELSWSLEESVMSAVHSIGALLVLFSIFPAAVGIVVPACYGYYLLQERYRRAGREVKRVLAISRSPRFSHFRETLDGLTVLRAFRRQQAFTEKFYETLAENQRAFHGVILINRWFSVRMPLISAGISIFAVAAIIFFARSGLLFSGTAGLVLMYTFRFWDSLDWSIRSFSEAEARMTSVERMKKLVALQDEGANREDNFINPPPSWGRQGVIEFREVQAKYDEHLPLVMKGVSFKIPACTKVGIIGRTGAGKSTISQLLLNFIIPLRGQINIDGIDITKIPLDRLRKSIANIPQNPILFRGTLRDNLDPGRQYTDEQIWNALERTHLEANIRRSSLGLLSEVRENGRNFSQGQRQLICLARAFLCDASIVVMDEATASIDVATDALVQQAIQRECRDKTVIIIAHRLNTIKSCDLVVELSDGKIKSSSSVDLLGGYDSPTLVSALD
ncbi:MAG: ABC transporter transmembrane domain-containing protein [Oligoflexales bacterium]